MLLLTLASLHATGPAAAHGGVDHGDDLGAAEIHRVSAPRFTALSRAYELVGIVAGERIRLYLDDAVTNAPVRDARLELDAGERALTATPHVDGYYTVPAGWLRPGATYELALVIQAPAGDDLLSARLTIPAPAASARESATPGLPDWDAATMAAALGGLVLAVWLGGATAVRIRNPLGGGVAAVVVLGLGVALGTLGRAHIDDLLAQIRGGGAHAEPAGSAAATPAAPDARPRRLADGTLFVPKAAQRPLALRTFPAESRTVARTRQLRGSVQPDPSASATVQAAQRGSLHPPDAGFPLLGTRVTKGDVLAYLRPALSPSERAAKESELALVERDIYLTSRQMERLRDQLGRMGDNSIQIDIRQAELRGFKAQQRALEQALHGRVALRAPVDGVVAAADVTTGRVVAPGETLFEIIQPERLRVEAVSYDGSVPAADAPAHALTADGRRIPLRFLGASQRLEGLGRPLQFAVAHAATEGSPPGGLLTTGELVDVHIADRNTLEGVQVPRDSIVLGATGKPVVWVHADAERFEPRVVESRSLDADTELVTAGLEPGTRVVEPGGARLLASLP